MPDHSHHHLDFSSPDVAAFAELEAEVLAGMVAQATARLADIRPDTRRILDVGCGPGVGTCLLAERFPSAAVVAADGSPAMLERAVARADRLGVGDRVQATLVELPGGLEALEPADLVWASMVLHHVGDEAEALGRMRRLLAPGGILALVERAGPVRILAEGTDAALWERLQAAWAAWFADMRGGLPGATASGEYPDMLHQAGFELVAEEVLTLALDPPLDERARRFASDQLDRMRTQLEPYAAADDLAALAALAEGGAADAPLRASRHLYVGRAD